jgi:hypothetical protein
MALITTGFSEPLVHAPKARRGDYDYRIGTGLMSSAEHAAFFDDFTQSVASNVPLGWTAAVIDAGATTVIDTTAAIGANGVLLMSDATASEGAAFYGSKCIQLTANKKFFMEMRVRTGDVTDNAIQFGLSSLTATTNPEDLWTTVATDLVAFGILDGSAVPTMLADKSNSGTSAQVASSGTLVVNTWHTLAIGYNGSKLRGYLDGREVLLWSSADSTIPTGVALAPFVGVLNGDGAGAAVNYVDYVRWACQR